MGAEATLNDIWFRLLASTHQGNSVTRTMTAGKRSLTILISLLLSHELKGLVFKNLLHVFYRSLVFARAPAFTCATSSAR